MNMQKKTFNLIQLTAEQFLSDLHDLHNPDFPPEENPYTRFEQYQQSLEFNTLFLGEMEILPVRSLTIGEQQLNQVLQTQHMEVEQFQERMQQEEYNILAPHQTLTNEEQDPNEANEEKRQDAKYFSQNMSSTGITIVSRLLTNNMGKDVKNNVRIHFESFLKEKAKINSLISLVFVYLFFLQNRVLAMVYSSFKIEMHKYLDKRRKAALGKEENQKRALMKKINANNDLLDYLFTLNGAQVNFQIIKKKSLRLLSQPIEQNKQAKQLEYQLGLAVRIYKQIMEL